MARPSPLDAPVISAVFPSSLFMSSSSRATLAAASGAGQNPA
jgi:hypothetical protein